MSDLGLGMDVRDLNSTQLSWTIPADEYRPLRPLAGLGFGSLADPHCTYLMIAILHKQFKLPGTLHRTLQVLSVHPFEKVSLNELLTESNHGNFNNSDFNQLNLF